MRKIIGTTVLALGLVFSTMLLGAGPAAADKPRLGIHGTQGVCKTLPYISAPAGEHGADVIRQLIDRCLRIRP